MIRELHNPLHDITWNCKNNYDTYTTDYDPEHNHFDRISMDVMATERTLNRIQQLQGKIDGAGWYKGLDSISNTDKAVLRSLRAELGLPEDERTPDVGNLNVRQAVETAVAEHAAQPGQEKGYIKAEGLHQANIL